MNQATKMLTRDFFLILSLISLPAGCSDTIKSVSHSSQLSESSVSEKLVFADSVGIRLDYKSLGYEGGGVIYSTTVEMPGIIAFFRDDPTWKTNFGYIDNVCQPKVSVKIRGLGATLGKIDQYDEVIHLANLNGKTVGDIFGNYFGIKAGAAFFPLGFREALAVNSSGAMIADIGHIMGLNVDLSGTMISIRPIGNPSQDCLDQKISTRTTDFEPQWILANEKAVAKVRQIVPHSERRWSIDDKAVVEVMIQDHQGKTVLEPTRLTYHPRQGQFRKDHLTKSITFNVLGPKHKDACYLNIKGLLPILGDIEGWYGKCPGDDLNKNP
jgi:hypothetical protein